MGRGGTDLGVVRFWVRLELLWTCLCGNVANVVLEIFELELSFSCEVVGWPHARLEPSEFSWASQDV